MESDPLRAQSYALKAMYPCTIRYIENVAAARAALYVRQEYLDDPDDAQFPVYDAWEIADELFPLLDDAEDAPAVAFTAPPAVTPAPKWASPKKVAPAPTPALPPHPIHTVQPVAPPKGWRVALSRAAARQIAGWYVGRPTTEWSALALVDTHWSKEGVAAFVVRECFFCDAGDDSGGHSQIPATWHAKLVDRLLTEDRDADIARLIGHVHSHNAMDAFWSSTDDEMVGRRLDEMAADTTRAQGIAISVVVGTQLTARARLDWFIRKGDALAYHTFDPVPLQGKFPERVALKDILDSSGSLARASTHAYPSAAGTYPLLEDDDEWDAYVHSLSGHGLRIGAHGP